MMQTTDDSLVKRLMRTARGQSRVAVPVFASLAQSLFLNPASASRPQTYQVFVQIARFKIALNAPLLEVVATLFEL